MLVYLIRHGQKQEIENNPPLTDFGKNQAEKTGNYFKNLSIRQIISSPLLRTIQTAQIISRINNLPFQSNPLLRERLNWGDIPNQSFTQFLQTWQTMSLNRHYKPYNLNSAFETGNRLNQFIKNNLKSNQNILIVTHGGIISDFLINNFEKNTLLKFNPDYDFIFNSHIKECSLTILNYQNSKFTLKSLAFTQHLN